MKLLSALAIALSIIGGVAVYSHSEQPEITHAIQAPEICQDNEACELFELTNSYRLSVGLPRLAYSKDAESVAKARAVELCETNTFTHDGWVDFLNIGYTKAGENLARGYLSQSKAFGALKASPTHLDNIEGDWNALGVFTEDCSGLNITVQIFIQV